MLTSEIVGFVKRAIAERVAMAISYEADDGTASQRVILPYYLMANRDGQLYIHCIANRRDGPGNAKRTFRADRIKGLRLGSEVMEPAHITELAHLYKLAQPPVGRCLAAQKIDRRR